MADSLLEHTSALLSEIRATCPRCGVIDSTTASSSSTATLHSGQGGHAASSVLIDRRRVVFVGAAGHRGLFESCYLVGRLLSFDICA